MLFASGVWVILDMGPVLGKNQNPKHGAGALAIEDHTLVFIVKVTWFCYRGDRIEHVKDDKV